MGTEKEPKSYNLFGEAVTSNKDILRGKFIEPPFSVLDTKTASWQKRKREWLSLGLESEKGRDEHLLFDTKNKDNEFAQMLAEIGGTSIFDPALCELLYHWFCPKHGTVLDPFSGGAVRGIVANYMGFRYTGIDIRMEQVKENRAQAKLILEENNQPTWICGDAKESLFSEWSDEPKLGERFDFILSCPPYWNLEVYSDNPKDISNMSYEKFIGIYSEIIKHACIHLKRGKFACFVVGEVRDEKGIYVGFVPDTIRAFRDAGCDFYNEAILLNVIGTASVRAGNYMKNHKLAKIHQNVLVFQKR